LVGEAVVIIEDIAQFFTTFCLGGDTDWGLDVLDIRQEALDSARPENLRLNKYKRSGLVFLMKGCKAGCPYNEALQFLY
jgi:hypothetical protein